MTLRLAIDDDVREEKDAHGSGNRPAQFPILSVDANRFEESQRGSKQKHEGNEDGVLSTKGGGVERLHDGLDDSGHHETG